MHQYEDEQLQSIWSKEDLTKEIVNIQGIKCEDMQFHGIRIKEDLIEEMVDDYPKHQSEDEYF